MTASFHFIGDSYTDYFCFLDGNLPEEGGDARLIVPIEPQAGGSAANTTTHFASLMMSENLACDVVLHTALNPDDENGKIQLKHAEKYQLKVVNCRKPSSEAATGHCVVIVAKGERTFMTHQGSMGEFEANDIDFEALARIEGPIHVHIAGYYNIPGFWNGKLKGQLELLRSKRERVGESTTLSLVPQHDATGEWKGGLLDLFPILHFVFMNELEAHYIMHTHTKQDEDPISQWVAFFASVCPKTHVIVTRGEAGALSIQNGKVLASQPTVPLEPLDPTGAGDAFIAGYLYGMWKRRRSLDPSNESWPIDAIENGLLYGVSVGTCSVLRKGASVPTPTSEIEDYAKRITSL